jgi:hypothetical protein
MNLQPNSNKIDGPSGLLNLVTEFLTLIKVFPLKLVTVLKGLKPKILKLLVLTNISQIKVQPYVGNKPKDKLVMMN